MPVIRLFVLAALLPLALPAAPAPPGRLTLESIFADGAGGRLPGNLQWSADGSRLAYTWEDETGEALFILDAATGGSAPVLRLASAEEPPAGTKEGSKTGEGFELDELLWSPTGDALLLVSDGDLYLLPAAGGKPARLTTTEADEEDPKFSPDGGRVAFVREADLWLLDLASTKETRLTRDGKEGEVLNGTTDWLYWEEIWGRDSTGHWWSPDGAAIAYYRFDESPVGRYPLVDMLPKYPEVEWQKYPKAGEPNPQVKVGVLDLASGRTTWLATGGAEEGYLARVDWLPKGDAVAVQRLNREQDRLELLRCAPADGRCSTLHVEEWPTWVNLGDDYRFLADGRFLWGSERDGWRRLYLHAADGRRLHPVTPEGWSVASLDGVLEESGRLVATGFATTGLGAAGRQVIRARLDGGGSEPLATEPGWNEAVVAPRTGHWVHTWSDADTPGARTLRRLDGGAGQPLPSAPAKGFDPAALPAWELLVIDGPGGAKLPARLLKPAGFDPARRYPAIVYHYGGPGSQVVTNRWDSRGRDLWHKMMAERGYAVFSVDNRASLFFGKKGEDLIHRNFGDVNLEAQLAGVEHLKGLGWIDPSRIGLWGWSGGGSNTLDCVLKRPGVWTAAVAGAPVTDWHLYDTVWTERYLDRPQDNPKGYEDSSPVTRAGNLADRLLVVHGTGDDNVHPQNTEVLAQKFIDAGLPFEQALYPKQKHGFRGKANRHFFARMTEFFERSLGAAGR